jgi:hypothetical protein
MVVLIILFLSILSMAVFAQETRQLATGKPQAIADLRSIEGAALVNAKWSVQNAHIVSENFKMPGKGENGDPLLLYPTGYEIKTNQLHPQIGAADFENGFREIKPTELECRQGTGLLSFVWYKVELTIPAMVGKLNSRGTTAVFEIVMDDYSEVWVNGKQMQGFGLAMVLSVASIQGTVLFSAMMQSPVIIFPSLFLVSMVLLVNCQIIIYGFAMRWWIFTKKVCQQILPGKILVRYILLMKD